MNIALLNRLPRWGIYALFGIAGILLTTFNLETTPPLWWDEGWTLLVARTWVERACYCRLFDGELAPPGLEASFPTTGMVALSFRLFGVGVWQARLVGVVFTFAAFAIVGWLARQLYNRRVAFATWFALVAMSMHPQANPIVMARQAIAEPVMLTTLLLGYVLMLLALTRAARWIFAAILVWGIALASKSQPVPFWAVSLAIPLLFALLARRWKSAGLIGSALIGSYAMMRGWFAVQPIVLGASYFPPIEVMGLYDVLAVVLVPAMRWHAVTLVMQFALPTLCALVYAVWKMKPAVSGADGTELVRVALFTFVATWLAWFILFANASIPRYVYPPVFFGSVFLGAFLADLTQQFDLRATLDYANRVLRWRRFDRAGARALAAILLVALAVPFTLLILVYAFAFDASASARTVSEYLNARTPPRARIESYDPEIFFFLERPYHYPPDQTHVELIRRTMYPTTLVEYDPLRADPDYLVIGPFGKGWRVYDAALTAGAFRWIHQEGAYQIYERVR